MNSGSDSRSGVAKTMSLVALADRIERRFLLACSLSALLTCAAAMPASSSLSAWSFISEISGETTTVVPGRCSAGNW